MRTDKEMQDKTIATIDGKTTPAQADAQASVTVMMAESDSTTDCSALVSPVESITVSKGIQLTAKPENSTKATDMLLTKMEMATAIFKRMRKSKGITRKEIIDQFVVDAKLSKAGAATYYQLIKAKVKSG